MNGRLFSKVALSPVCAGDGPDPDGRASAGRRRCVTACPNSAATRVAFRMGESAHSANFSPACPGRSAARPLKGRGRTAENPRCAAEPGPRFLHALTNRGPGSAVHHERRRCHGLASKVFVRSCCTASGTRTLLAPMREGGRSSNHGACLDARICPFRWFAEYWMPRLRGA